MERIIEYSTLSYLIPLILTAVIAKYAVIAFLIVIFWALNIAAGISTLELLIRL